MSRPDLPSSWPTLAFSCTAAICFALEKIAYELREARKP